MKKEKFRDNLTLSQNDKMLYLFIQEKNENYSLRWCLSKDTVPSAYCVNPNTAMPFVNLTMDKQVSLLSIKYHRIIES